VLEEYDTPTVLVPHLDAAKHAAAELRENLRSQNKAENARAMLRRYATCGFRRAGFDTHSTGAGGVIPATPCQRRSHFSNSLAEGSAGSLRATIRGRRGSPRGHAAAVGAPSRKRRGPREKERAVDVTTRPLP
jgi:hypothetical protein